MRKDSLELLEERAVAALCSVYDKNIIRDLEETGQDCQSYLLQGGGQSKTFKKIWIQAARKKITIDLTKTIINSLSADKKRYVMLKYGHKWKNPKMSADLFASEATLNNWNHKILDAVIKYAILMELHEENIYFKPLAINLVQTFKHFIAFADRVDPNGEVISKYYLKTLSFRMHNYRRIIKKLDDVVKESEDGTINKVLTQKIMNPHERGDNIAHFCRIDKGIVSKTLHEFCMTMRPYLE